LVLDELEPPPFDEPPPVWELPPPVDPPPLLGGVVVVGAGVVSTGVVWTGVVAEDVYVGGAVSSLEAAALLTVDVVPLAWCCGRCLWWCTAACA
jgi:hypothetical protein